MVLEALSTLSHLASFTMLLVGIFKLDKKDLLGKLILAYIVYHNLTDIAFHYTSSRGINNWFLQDIVTIPEWLINGAILTYIWNRQKSGYIIILSYLVVLSVCMFFKEPGTYWTSHLTSIVTTFACLFVWLSFIQRANPERILKLKRFWILLSITLLQSISSFTLLLYEIVEMDQHDFLPSIIITTFVITVLLTYLACIKACLCKET